MDRGEARKVAEIMKTADSGCPDCVSALAGQLAEAFPEFADVFERAVRGVG